MKSTWPLSIVRRGLVLAALAHLIAFASSASAAGVELREDATTYTMSNGTLSVKVSKESGDLVSMRVNDRETLHGGSGHPFAYWSHDVKGGTALEARVTIDPTKNNGERAEVSIKGISGGKPMGHGPGAPPEGDVAVDIDLRYSLARDDSAVYAYSIFEHKPEYPAGDFTEARLAAKLDPSFTHLHVDDLRSGKYPLISENADKYIYTTVQFDHRAYGATNPKDGLGWWMLIPSPEYLSAGPTQPDFLVHGELVVFCYWRSSHYGHAQIILEAGESWKKVIGPIVMYANAGESSEAMWADAKARLAKEEAKWPYAWAEGGDYVKKEDRAAVSGRIVLRDPIARNDGQLPGRLTVGLTKTPYTVKQGDATREIDWQHDAKHYQYWVHSPNRDGSFTIPNVPQGTYNLHAFADGVLGELFKANVVVSSASSVNIGDVEWTPPRQGKPVWEIGKPDRDAMEFAGADRFWHPGAALRYRDAFPGEVTFTIGESDPSKHWFYAHMPFVDDPNARIRPFFGVSGENKDATRNIVFDLPSPPSGTATLRVAITGSGGKSSLNLRVNGNDLPAINFGLADGALTRHQIRGDWRERAAEIDASLLKSGKNTISLTVPKGSPGDGVIYDYLRLEMDSGS